MQIQIEKCWNTDAREQYADWNLRRCEKRAGRSVGQRDESGPKNCADEQERTGIRSHDAPRHMRNDKPCKTDNTPESNGRKEDSMRGVKLIWPQMNGFCSYTGIYQFKKIKLDI